MGLVCASSWGAATPRWRPRGCCPSGGCRVGAGRDDADPADPSELPSPLTGRRGSGRGAVTAVVPPSPTASATRHRGMLPGRAAAQLSCR